MKLKTKEKSKSTSRSTSLDDVEQDLSPAYPSKNLTGRVSSLDDVTEEVKRDSAHEPDGRGDSTYLRSSSFRTVSLDDVSSPPSRKAMPKKDWGLIRKESLALSAFVEGGQQIASEVYEPKVRWAGDLLCMAMVVRQVLTVLTEVS